MIRSKRLAIQEAARCLLCMDAPCAKACPKQARPDNFVRSLRFEYAAAGPPCADCQSPCEEVCIHPDFPVRIKELSAFGGAHQKEPSSLAIDFCGVTCENPFFLSSSVIASGYDMCARALKMGWGGLVYKTIGFMAIKEASPRFDILRKDGGEFIGFRNWEQISQNPYEEDFDVLQRLKRDFPTKVIAASIMGQNESEWEYLARLCNEAGVDIIECNFGCPHMSAEGLGSDTGCDPAQVARFTSAVRKQTKLPILAKMTPNITNIELPAAAAVKAGATGIAAINTIKSVTSVLEQAPHPSGKPAVSGYSGRAVKPIALRFISDVRAALPNVPISGMGGIETWRDAAEFMAMGCANVQVTTAVMQYGYRIIDDLTAGLAEYIARRGVTLTELVSSAKAIAACDIDRETVIYPVFDKDVCVSCGRCAIGCADGGHQAIEFDRRKPKLIAGNCEGCMLCSFVCPADAVSQSGRAAKRES